MMIKVIVNYNHATDISEILPQINCVANPHIVLWYIGQHGLRGNSLNFHRQIIAPIYENNKNALFWLYDLTAWGALKNPNISISKKSRHTTKISSIDSQRIKCISAADIFNKMQTITDHTCINYLQKALARDFIWQASRSALPAGIMIEDLFKNNCQLLKKYGQSDTNHAYSMLQYLEGCLLVDQIVNITMSTNSQKCMQLFFILPNDEIKYYQDKTNVFAKDIEFLLKQRYNLVGGLKIIVNFFPFKYGEFEHHRPYHDFGAAVKSSELQNLHRLNKNDSE